MKYIFVTLFKNLIEPYFSESILYRAINKKLIEIEFFNPRDFTKDKHKRIDKALIGGGAGMLMTAQPMFDTLNYIREKNQGAKFIFLTPVGKSFNQKDAIRLAKTEKTIVFVSSRYEGVDERVVEEFADEVFSIGDYILTGGELSSLVICDSISRNIDAVLGNSASLSEESFNSNLLEAPSFTKPNIFQNREIIREFLNGNHTKIAKLKIDLSICKTKFHRIKLFNKLALK